MVGVVGTHDTCGDVGIASDIPLLQERTELVRIQRHSYFSSCLNTLSF